MKYWPREVRERKGNVSLPLCSQEESISCGVPCVLFQIRFISLSYVLPSDTLVYPSEWAQNTSNLWQTIMSWFQEHTFATPSSWVPAVSEQIDDDLSSWLRVQQWTYLMKHWSMLLVFPTDKNFDDEDSVDGGRSSSSTSSKGFSSSRRGGSMGSMRRPSSASGSRATGKTTAATAQPRLQLRNWSQIRVKHCRDIHKYFT